MTRGSTSKEILELDWDYPVASKFEDDVSKGPHTVAKRARRALSREEAFKVIAKDDQRPLLVLRECTQCKGTEHALFSRRLNNEKTKLLLQWFHCVKLPPDVLDPTHPFHAVFATDARSVPHLFISRFDGSNPQHFDGTQSQSELQKALTALVEECFEKKPDVALKSMLRFLSEFDMLDHRETELLAAFDKAREAKGPESSAAKKVAQKLELVRKQKATAMKRARAVCDLELIVVQDKKAD